MSSEIVEAALRTNSLIVQFVTAESGLLASGLNAILKRGEATVYVRDGLPTPQTNFAVEFIVAGMTLFPTDEYWSCPSGFMTTSVADLDTYLRVDVGSDDQRKLQQAAQLAADLLLPGELAVSEFQEHGQTASEIAENFELPLEIVLSQLEKYALVPVKSKTAEPTKAAKDWSLDALDPSQRAAASANPGPVLVGAGPGTGKTRTLVARVIHLVRDLHVKPHQILALTYNRAAAAQMQEQITEALESVDVSGPKTGKPWVGTLHSFGMQIVRKYYAELGYESEPVLIDTLGAVDLLEANLDKCGLDLLLNLYDPAPNLVSILGRISRAKDELCSPARYLELSQSMLHAAQRSLEIMEHNLASGEKIKKPEEDPIRDAVVDAQKCIEIAHSYAIYEKIKFERGVVDYGDLITLPVKLFEKHLEIVREIGRQYTHILADEYQDVNRASARMLKLLSSSNYGAGLWVVGDHRQSIYRFRGASPINIHSFETDFPSGKRFELEVNYRSVKPIVDCFSAFANTAGFMADQAHNWRAHRNDSPLDAIQLFEAETVDSQNARLVSWVANEISSGKKASDIAVLCRTNTQVEQISTVLEESQIETLTIGDPFTRPEVQNVLALVALSSGELLPALYQIAQIPGLTECSEITHEISQILGSPIIVQSEDDFTDPELDNESPEPLRHDLISVLSHTKHPAARQLETIYEQLQQFTDRPHQLIQFIIFDLMPRLAKTSGENQPRFNIQTGLALQHVIGLASAFEQITAREGKFTPNRTRDFLVYLKRMISLVLVPRITPINTESADHVQVMTIHGAKGLEFPVTILPFLSKSGFHTRGFSDGLTDPSGMVDDTDELSEDRFLFFVGLSRAKDKLVLARPLGNGDKQLPMSPLLEQLSPWLESHGVTSEQWNATEISDSHTDAGTSPFTPSLTGRTPVFTESALATYMRCPRQYYFQHVEKLSVASPKSAYQKLHAVVWETLGYMRDSWASGETTVVSDMLDHLHELWPESGLAGVQNESIYLTKATTMVTNAFEFGTRGLEVAKDMRLETELEGARVKISPDAAFESGDGASVTLVKYKTGRKGSNDHNAPSLSLMRQAAQSHGRDINIELRYLATGDITETKPNAKLEPARVQKYVAAVQGILEQKFEPISGRECRNCAFMLICDRKGG